jgi:type I restriction enzyme S subunit
LGFTQKIQAFFEICTIQKGEGLSKDGLIKDGKYPCVLYGELYTIYSEVIDKVNSRTNNLGKRVSEYGDILFPGSTTTTGIDLANATAIKAKGVLLGGDIIVLKQKAENIYDPTFMAFYLTHIKKFEIAKYAQGITIVHLYGKDLLKLKLVLPSFERQKKISEILTKAKNEINNLKDLTQKYKTQKRGLMQKLLTGVWRVKV